ncbi:biotin transporter BioY [Corynebacterium terpenotabidum]|uniref:Biotin transporter n=1 Tax=Corynebacterium terpenotabidum Y-11 TaxID=1200352 RepID=S4XK73_9CORY|nr:biotin transporter BioY [Corynebacterium terpenotabidum]AGP30943.1 BioY family protein [Corynebacterium terpenotabidum Y-11]
MPKRTVSVGRISAADIAVIAAFAALIIVLGAVSIPVGSSGVPIVLQNMGIAMAGMILGWRRGGLAVLLFLGVGFLGVPNMAGWTPALTAVSGPTVGYIVGYAVIGFVIGALCDIAPRRPQSLQLAWFFVAGVVGVAICYLLGSVGLVIRTDMDFGAALAANVPFIPGDLIKTVVAALVSTAVLRAIPDLRSERGVAEKRNTDDVTTDEPSISVS